MKNAKQDLNDPSISLALTDVRIACLMVDYRDEPEVQKVLIEKRHSLAAVLQERAAETAGPAPAMAAEDEAETAAETVPEPVPERRPARPLRLFGQPVA